MQDVQVDEFIRLKVKQGIPTELPLELHAMLGTTDDSEHGDHARKIFHGYCKSYCYLPLCPFCGDWPLAPALHLTLRKYSLAGTEMEKAQADTIHTKLPKMSGRVNHGCPDT